MIEVITDLERLRALAGDWDKLAGPTNNPLLQHDWFFHCAENLGDESRLQVHVYWEGTEVHAIAPLVVAPRGNVMWLEVLGAGELYEPTDLLFQDPDSLHHLLQALVRQHLPVNLQRVPNESRTLNQSRVACRGRGLVLFRRNTGSSYLPIMSDWESMHKSMAKKWRAEFRKKRIRAERLGTVSVDIDCPTGSALVQKLDECIRIEASGWKGRNGTAIRDRPFLHRFVRNYAATASRRGTLRICILRIAGQGVAMKIGVEFQNRLWFLKTGYDEDWMHISPGMLLTHEMIRYAFSKKLTGYEFLGSEEMWQHAWPVAVHPYSSVLIYPFSPHGWRGLCEAGKSYLATRFASLTASVRGPTAKPPRQ